MITILTPTYNRAYTLERCYKSLTKQTDKDFEWIVVDDGSTDDTKSLVDTFIKKKNINVYYYYKENGGKCSALNVGIKKAKGELVLILDSDDYLDVNAIKLVKKYWKKYSDDKKIAGMTFLRKIKNPIYNTVQFEECVSNMIDFKYNRHILADMCEIIRTDILKKYPYPIFKGEKFLSEVIVTGEIAKIYNMAYIPKEIYYTEYLPDGLSKNWLRLVVNNPKGARANAKQFMSKQYKFNIRVKNCIEFIVFSIISKSPILSESPMKILTILFYLPSLVVAKVLKIKYKRR